VHHPDSGIPQQTRQFADLPAVVARGRAQEISSRCGDVPLIVVALVGDAVLEIHGARQQVDRGDTVGQCVMDLADQRKPAPGQPLGEMKLPQGAGAVQRRRRDLADDLVEFSAAARCGHLHPAQVVVQIDLAVLLPHRVMQLPGNVHQLVAQWLEQMQPTAHVVAESVEAEPAVAAGRVDHRHLQRVRVQVGGLAVEQHGVHAVESLHAPRRHLSGSISPGRVTGADQRGA
jgi:hypothetical protein